MLINTDTYNEYFKTYYDHKDPNIKDIIRNSTDLLLNTNRRFFRHQNFIHNVIQEYDKVFLYHETGTGKTCSSLGAAEIFKKYFENNKLIPNYIDNNVDYIRHTFVLVSGDILINEFKDQLICICSDIYLNQIRKSGKSSTRYINTLIDKYYTIKGYESFVSQSLNEFLLKNVDATGDDYIKYIHDNYDNSFFIIDEVHNLRLSKFNNMEPDEFIKSLRDRQLSVDKELVYQHLYHIFHTADNLKIMLLSATPMINSVIDIVSPFNLINPIDLQLSYNKTNYTYDELEPYIRGLVSYVEANKSNKRSVYISNSNEYGDYYGVNIRGIQLEKYIEISNSNDKFYQLLRQVSNIYLINRDINRTLSFIDSIDTLGDYSAKFEFILNNIDNAKHNVYVFSNYVTYGVEALGKCLEKFKGYEELVITQDIQSTKIICEEQDEMPIKLDKRKRYILLVSKSDTKNKFDNLIKIFNHPSNKYGEYVKAILVSPMGREGISFHNVTQIYSLEPDWNNSNIHQGISRAIRIDSHLDLIGEDYNIEIYKLMSVIDKNTYDVISIDEYLIEQSRIKEIEINTIYDFMRRSAIDRFLGDNIDNVYINTLEDLFNTKSVYSIDELSALLNIDRRNLINKLNELIDKQTMFVNKLGINMFLARTKYEYFLTPELSNGYGKSYYSNKQVLEYKPDISKLLEYEYKNSPNTIQYEIYNLEDKLINNEDIDKFEDYYFYVLPESKEVIENYRITNNLDFDKLYLSESPENSIGIVHDMFRVVPNINKHGTGSRIMKVGPRLRIILYEEKLDSFRDLVPYEVIPYSYAIEQFYRNRFEDILQYELYGTISPTSDNIKDTFKIVHNVGTERIDDSRFKSTGRVCKTIEFPNIVKHMLYLYQNPNIENKQDLEVDIIIDIDDCIDYIQNESMHLNLNEYNDEEILYIGNWLHKIKTDRIDKSYTCDLLYLVMEYNRLLLPVI